jgi:hypothetical protein
MTSPPNPGRYLFANFGFYRADTGRPRSWFTDLEGRHWSQLSIFEAEHPWGCARPQSWRPAALDNTIAAGGRVGVRGLQLVASGSYSSIAVVASSPG